MLADVQAARSRSHVSAASHSAFSRVVWHVLAERAQILNLCGEAFLSPYGARASALSAASLARRAYSE
jgi:hypothetical protein